MRRMWNRSLAVLVASALALTACGGDDDTTSADDTPDAEEDFQVLSEDDLFAGQPDPNDEVEDGVYRAEAVVLPIPDGWELDRNAYAVGVVAAISEDGEQQLTAQAFDPTFGGDADEPIQFEELLEEVRIIGEADVDEEFDLPGAVRAQRISFYDLPGHEQEMPDTSATIIIAEDDRGLLAEFSYGASSDVYDEAIETLLLEGAAFDPESEPEVALPLLPEGDITDEELDEFFEQFGNVEEQPVEPDNGDSAGGGVSGDPGDGTGADDGAGDSGNGDDGS